MPKHSSGNKAPSHRQLKVGEELRHVLSDIFMRGDFYMQDGAQPKNITVSEVRISPDLRNATVFIMPLGGENKQETVNRLRTISRQLRSEVSNRVQLRHTPELFFKLDESFDRASEIENLLRQPQVQKDLGEPV